MIVAAVALGWALICVAALARLRPVSATRSYALLPAHHMARHLRMTRPSQRFTSSVSRRALLGGLALIVLAAVVFPPAALAVVSAALIAPVARQRRARNALALSVERDVSDAVVLVALAISSGHNLTGALRAACQHGDGPVFRSFRSALGLVDRGERLADALDSLPDELGDAVRPTVAALVSCDRYGAALGPTLERLSADVRTASRQRAEAAARRLPVRLLFPLITCILPAFALLTVAPLIAGSFRGLRL